MVNSSRVHLRRQVQRFAKGTHRGMLVLDAGAGRSPYRKLFKHARYEAADFAALDTEYAPLDYVCDLSAIPVEDNRFDRILFNQVLEHIPDPDVVLAELYRVLKPGGRLMCSAPLYYSEHQAPYDFYRYTQFGLRHRFESAGFKVVRLDWLEGYFGTIGYQFHQMYHWLPPDLSSVRALGLGKRVVYIAPTLLATRAVAGRLRGFYAQLDVDSKQTGRGMPKNYLLIAVKPKDPA